MALNEFSSQRLYCCLQFKQHRQISLKRTMLVYFRRLVLISLVYLLQVLNKAELFVILFLDYWMK